MLTHRIIVQSYDLDKLYRSLTHGGEIYAQHLDMIKEITVVDPYTVEITLKAYAPVFLLRMVGYQPSAAWLLRAYTDGAAGVQSRQS